MMAEQFIMYRTDANKELLKAVIKAIKDSEVSALFNLGGTIYFRNPDTHISEEHIHISSGDNMLRTVAMYVCEKGWDIKAIDRDTDTGAIAVVLIKGEE